MEDKEAKRLASYYDSDNKLKQYPKKHTYRMIVLEKIHAAFEFDRTYTEKEVNEIIKDNISFNDIEYIRRELIDNKLLNRLLDGSKYWKE